jgi:hypothetical protein
MNASVARKIVLVLNEVDFIAWYGPLLEPLHRAGFQTVVALNTHLHTKLQHRVIDKLPEVTAALPTLYMFYDTAAGLAQLLDRLAPHAVLTVEGIPLAPHPEPFRTRRYRVYSLIHATDSWVTRPGANEVIDRVIVPYDAYGTYLGWNNIPTVTLGHPKYDIVGHLDPGAIRKKYRLPSRYLLLFAPNRELLSISALRKIIRFWHRHGYAVVLKGKKPKCHTPLYHVLADAYILNKRFFYPFIVHELMVGSCGAMGFDTTAVEEALMFEKPMINLSVKPYRFTHRGFRQYERMWGSAFCLDIDFRDHNWSRVEIAHPELVLHLTRSFDYRAIQQSVYTVPGGAADRVAAFIRQEVGHRR